MTATITKSLLARVVADIAFVAEAQPATTFADLGEQAQTAAQRLDDAGISGSEELDAAAIYLLDADRTSGAERDTLLNRAAELLTDTPDMVDEYRLMG
ncbi:hypothetical protein [Streptomyces niveus]